jgi:NAD-dependent deacetylase
MTTVEIPEPLVDRLRDARRIVVLTGAGVSAESGVPTFRDAQTGLWAQYDPAQLATPEAFRSDPELVWGWYLWRRELTRKAAPNPGHEALARLQDLVDELVLVTQNVDGLHARAGSRDVIELHGNIMRTVCFRCGVESGGEVDLDSGVPECVACGGPLRPDVVWFGEALPMDALTRAAEAARTSQLFLSVGTSSLVYPAAGLPYEALTAGVPVVEINPAPTALSGRATWTLRGPSGTVLPSLVAALDPEHS